MFKQEHKLLRSSYALHYIYINNKIISIINKKKRKSPEWITQKYSFYQLIKQ